MPVRSVTVQTHGKGLIEITDAIRSAARDSGTTDGLCTVFIQHTSASLLIQENADPSARKDLEAWFDRLVAEGDSLYTHTHEGADDMPSHIPVGADRHLAVDPDDGGQLGLGRWQGIYLFEHRRQPHGRRLLVHVGP